MPEELAVVKQEQPLFLNPVMNVELAKSRLAEFQSFIKGYLVEGEDFGVIPGTPKPTLLKPGADKLCEIYGLTDTYEITSRIEHWEKNLFDYEIRCTLSKRDGTKWAEGMGSCNSYEGKYRWRDTQRKCPICAKETIIKGKAEYGGGWLCFAKKGGCGAKFKVGDHSIEGQTVGRTENDDIATLKNTILKMAKKRAKVDATLAATRSSGIFTQDMEDISQNGPGSHKDAPGSNGDPFVEGTVVEGSQLLGNTFGSEILAKKQKLKTVMANPCFTDDQRTVMNDNAANVKTLEGINKLLAKAEDHLKKNTRAQAKAEKEAAQLGITLEDASASQAF